MKSYKVHHVNFYKPEVHAIHCFSYDEESFNLAISRSDNSIEVWDLKHAPYQKQVYCCYQGCSVEALAWCGNRLFSTGLSAYIQEYSLYSLLPKNSTPSNGGPTWCLAFSEDKKFLAAGTEDGYISLFRVTDDTIEFERNFDNQEGRILCLAWHKNGETIVSGSADTIRIWNVATGYAVDRIAVGRIDQKTETTVWCLVFLGNGTVVSGDSWGRTSFWDSKTGTLIHESRDHKADVLALCASKDETSVYASGVDSTVIQYSQVCLQPSKSTVNTWVKSLQRLIHSHDVRALTVAHSYLASGGVDTYLTLNKYPPNLVLKYPALLQNGAVQLATKSRCLLLQYSKNLEIWELGSSKVTEKKGDGEAIPLSKDARKVLELCTKGDETIACSAVSSDIRWLAYSTLERLRLFYFILEDDPGSRVANVTLQKVKHLPTECSLATRLCFTPSGSKLVVANGHTIFVLGTNLIHPTLLHSFDAVSDSFVGRLCCSHDDQYVAAADFGGTITAYNLKDYNVLCSLPKHHCAATAIEFHPRSGNLFAAYADHKIVEYDLSKKAYTSWTRKLMKLASPYLNAHFPVLRITFDQENTVILHDDSTVYSIRIDELASISTKRSRQQENDVGNAEDVVTRTSTRYKHLLAFVQLEKDEMVAVEVLQSAITKQLPPALRRKKFGM